MAGPSIPPAGPSITTAEPSLPPSGPSVTTAGPSTPPDNNNNNCALTKALEEIRMLKENNRRLQEMFLNQREKKEKIRKNSSYLKRKQINMKSSMAQMLET